ncbi:PKD domain-containing protein [Ekhidna sp. MALMAid0563]|uniref:PKD domain-containing protein n=1 Tax=Ekhidna sp. MALMAid0563 TaxID=3143937 RepID=UPI0032DEA168
MKVRALILSVLLIVFRIGVAQDPVAEFSVQIEACQNEQLELSNSSTNASSYEWDFCVGDLKIIPTYTSSPASLGTTSTWGLELVEDNGLFYGFIPSRGDGRLIRLDFGSSITNEPTVNDLGDLGLDNVFAVSILNDGTGWKGIGSDNSNDELLLLDFGSAITTTPTITDITGTLSLSGPLELKLLEYNGSYWGFVVNFSGGYITRIDFGSSISSTFTHDNLSFGTSVGEVSDIEFISSCSAINAFVTSRSNGKLIKLDFGTDLSTSPTELVLTDTLTNPTSLSIAHDINFEVFIESFAVGGGLQRLSLDDNIALISGQYLGNVSGVDRETGLVLQRISSDWTLLSLSNKGNFGYYEFPQVCQSSVETSSDAEPVGVTYNQSGEYYIKLDAIGTCTDSKVDTITITPNTAPSISYTKDYVCETSPITFTPSNTGLSSYSWDFDGDEVEDSTDPIPSYEYSLAGGGPGPGTYTVRVDVSDGTCDNFYEEEITIYSDPPVPAFTVTASECVNTDISFANDTDESQHMGVISYMWDFDNDGTIDSTDPNPTFAYTTPGTKTVVLYDTIPGCSNVSATFDIEISPGPTAGFTPSTTSACEGDVVSFTDASSGDSQDYFWDFQNGFTSTASSPPAQLYENSGSYFVSLRTTDAQGCQNTFTQEISIAASPQISIDFDIPCTSPDGVQFYDLTTVDGADIVSWSWDVNGEEVSTEQNPTINFSSTGVKTVGLTVLSSNGCEQYASEDIEVLTAPSPDFSINLGCQGETTTFTDETSSVGNPIVSWLWTVDGTNYGTQDINHIFENPGSYDVTLEVTGQNFCSETITQTVEIIELPQVSFAVNGECDNQIIQVIDESTTSEDPVVSRRWMLDGANVGNGTELLLDEMEDGTYELELELETEFGCVVNSTQTLEINDAPESSFTSSRTYGIPGDQLTFTNTSTGGTSYQWLLDGALRSIESGSESITFPNPGEYIVGLVSENSLGCYDTTSQEILIAVPEVDLAIGSFELVNENNTGKIFMEIQNFSNLPVEITEAQLVLENEFRVSEQILEFIGVGESSLVSLNVGIPMTVSEPSYFCVKLISQYTAYDDINPVNNEKCLTMQPAVQVEDPFPNPVSNQFRLKVVVPDDGAATLRLINSAGKIHKENLFEATTGLNNFFVDMSTLNPGIYYVTVDVLGYTFKRKVIKL